MDETASQLDSPPEGRSVVFYAASLVGLAAVAALSWWLSSISEGNAKSLAIVLGILAGVVIVVTWLACDDPKTSLTTRRRMRRASALAVLTCATWWGAGKLGTPPPGTTVYVDNQSDRDVVLKLDGRTWVNVASHATSEAHIAFGTHEVVTTSADGAQELDRRQVEAKAERDSRAEGEAYYPYVFNVLGAATYLRGEASYGDMPANDFVAEVKDVWILADVDYVLRDAPSSLETSARWMTGTFAKYLKRAAP
jgi:hypothetical protein